MPTATTITIAETLDLLDGPLSSFSQGFQTGLYALWLGSGISRERVVGLDGVLAKLLENLRLRITGADCEHHHAFEKILNLADLSAAEKAQIDLSQPVASWPIHNELINRLWNKYSKVLGTEVDGRRFDYLLWDVLDFPTTFEAQKADAEHLAIAMLVLEGVVSDLATANWDGLLEAAMRELGRPNETFRVAVTGGDLQGPPGIGILYKFHGCANRAIENENEYRPLLVAREAAITHWAQNPRFTQMQEQLRALIARSRTLMIGLSGQDTNIQQLFTDIPQVACRLTSRSPDFARWASVFRPERCLSSRKRPKSGGSSLEPAAFWPGRAAFPRGRRTCPAAFVQLGHGSWSCA